MSASLAWLMPARAAERTEITFPGDHAYPESLTATSDGTIYGGSLYEGGIFRVPPGATTAEQWSCLQFYILGLPCSVLPKAALHRLHLAKAGSPQSRG